MAGEPGMAEHLAGCPACTAFSRRLDAVREALGRHDDRRVIPDEGFARRTVARLPQPAELLGWAALRALPAALALAFVLAWYGLSQPPPLSALLLDEPSGDELLLAAPGPATETASPVDGAS